MPKFETIKPGDVLWDYHSERAGNTTLRRWGNWQVVVREVYPETESALCSWNGNAPKKMFKRQLTRLRRTPGRERRDW